MRNRGDKNHQLGRSMVEMLGVLAIVGVLAVSGIVGFQYAMRLYRIAETYDEVSVTVSGARTWPILEHYGPLTKVVGLETGAPPPENDTSAYVVPVREVVSKVNYRKSMTAAEALDAGVSNKDLLDEVYKDSGEASQSYYARREYESFSSKSFAPVWTRAETPNAWTVRVTGLSYDMCMSLVSKREMGYQYTYMALEGDPSYWDMPLATSYTNEDMKDNEKVKSLCQEIDPAHRSMPPAYTFYKGIKRLNKEGSNITSVGECEMEDGVPSVRCMAYNARVDGLPLQTLVFYWGPDDSTDNPLPPMCKPGTCRDINDEPTKECCETEAGGLWVGEGICCQLGGELDSPKDVKIKGKYYQLTRALTGFDVEGNSVEECDIHEDREGDCCIAGTPWYTGNPEKIRGTCTGECPAGPESRTGPNQTEHETCCRLQAGGVWHGKPQSRANPLPKWDNPKDPNSGSDALCCWGGGSALFYDSLKPMSCEAPNVWSKHPIVISWENEDEIAVSTMRKRNAKGDVIKKGSVGVIPGGIVFFSCASTTPGTGPNNSSVSGDPDNPGSSNNVDPDTPGMTNADCEAVFNNNPEAINRLGMNAAAECCIYECSRRGLSGGFDGMACCCGPNCSGGSGSGSSGGGVSSFEPDPGGGSGTGTGGTPGMGWGAAIGLVADKKCSIPPVPPLNIYGEITTDCCDGSASNYGESALYSSKISEECCRASGKTFGIYATGTDECGLSCCEPGSIDPPALCCGDIGSKSNYKACCETDLKTTLADKAESWEVGKQIFVTTRQGDKCIQNVISTQDVCCKKGENGFDYRCSPNIACCGSDVNENMKSETCCPLVPNHYWDKTTNTCVPCGGETSCGDPTICKEVKFPDETHCCINNVGGNFEPYAWDPKTGNIYIEESCCPECIVDETMKSKFIGFTKAALAKNGKILGNCLSGFSIRSSN